MLKQSSIDRIGAKAANIASPFKEFFKLLAKRFAEFWFAKRHLGDIFWLMKH